MRWIALIAICLGLGTPARAEDWGVRRDPFDPGVVRRYKELLAKDPHDVRALRDLVALYRRYRTVEKLEAEYRTALGTTEDGAMLVVLARLPRASRGETHLLWQRAVKARPADAKAWLGAGDAAMQPAAARDAFRHAARHAVDPVLKRTALLKLVGAARSAADSATIDAAYGELIALAPKDGKLWLERGDAQLAANRPADAHASFVSAEKLLARDPERSLTAMMNQGLALERQGRVDDAIAQYERTLDKVPRGFHLASELVMRIVEAERRRKTLDAAIKRLEARWPEKSRGHFEWSLLGDLYKGVADDKRALAAYQQAVRKAPTEIVTQRKLITLLDALQPLDALAAHEAAARIAPGDADLQIELAKRYHPTAPDKAYATLDRLAKRMRTNVNVRRTIATLFTTWEQHDRAIREYEAIAKVEPREPEHHVFLGTIYWRAGKEDKARVAWKRLDTIGTAEAFYRHGQVLGLHDLWGDALVPFSKSLALDGTNPDVWRGRAQAYDELKRFEEAARDARRAVALIAHATRDGGDRERHLLARVLGRWHDEGGGDLQATLVRWRYAFEHGDVGAGYLLAAHHARIASPQLHELLLDLYKRVPADDSLGIAVARSFSRRKDFDRARTELEKIKRRSPARAETIDKLIGQVEGDRERAAEDARLADEGLSARYGRSRRVRENDIVGLRRRMGWRLGVGTDVRSDSGALFDVALYRASRLAPGTALTMRLDTAQRDDDMQTLDLISVSVGVMRRLVGTRTFELAAGVAPRVEIRYGGREGSPWHGVLLAADATLEILPRAMPLTLAGRFQQNLTGHARSSALLLELGFEMRW